jgi:Tetratricopeptide repeat
MHDLALTLYDLGDLAGARDLLQQVVDVTRRLLGAEHPTTRAAAKNLAWVQRALAEAAQ